MLSQPSPLIMATTSRLLRPGLCLFGLQRRLHLDSAVATVFLLSPSLAIGAVGLYPSPARYIALETRPSIFFSPPHHTHSILPPDSPTPISNICTNMNHCVNSFLLGLVLCLASLVGAVPAPIAYDLQAVHDQVDTRSTYHSFNVTVPRKPPCLFALSRIAANTWPRHLRQH